MSDRMTAVRPGDGSPGLDLWGRRSRGEAIAEYRAHYQRQLEAARHALSVSDDDLTVVTFLGPHARRNIEEVKDQ